jgi:hypothetical protein
LGGREGGRERERNKNGRNASKGNTTTFLKFNDSVLDV